MLYSVWDTRYIRARSPPLYIDMCAGLNPLNHTESHVRFIHATCACTVCCCARAHTLYKDLTYFLHHPVFSTQRAPHRVQLALVLVFVMRSSKCENSTAQASYIREGRGCRVGNHVMSTEALPSYTRLTGRLLLPIPACAFCPQFSVAFAALMRSLSAASILGVVGNLRAKKLGEPVFQRRSTSPSRNILEWPVLASPGSM